MTSRRLAILLGCAVFSCNSATSATLDAVCKKISGKLGSVSYEECSVLKMTASDYSSVNGVPLLIKEYPPLNQRKPRGRILLVGGTHGDELAAISIVFKWMHILEKHRI